MIFSAPRFVVVDDKEEHLLAIVKAFQHLGSPCLGVHYNQETGVDPIHFRGVRCLFMDLHLINSHASSDYKSQFSSIASILEDSISVTGGPYVLVLWTEQSHVCDELRAYLDKSIDPDKPYVRPLAVLSLAKEAFITPVDGKVIDSSKLQAAVLGSITENPQLAALLGWEVDVLSAAGDTLASLLNLIEVEQRTTENFPVAVDTILSRLARETVGKPHVEVNQRTAIYSALAPILMDRILNQDVPEATQDLWGKAVTRHNDRNLEAASPKEAGELNRILHLAVPGPETIRPTDWGAVVAWPFDWNDDGLKGFTGITIKQMLCEEFRLRSSAIASCKPVLVRIGAACDYAQDNRGPISYLFGLEIPSSAERQLDSNNNPLKLSDAIWQSPVFMTPGSQEASTLYFHFRFPLTFVKDACGGWGANYRLREQLLMQLITSVSGYVSRPGIVRLPT